MPGPEISLWVLLSPKECWDILCGPAFIHLDLLHRRKLGMKHKFEQISPHILIMHAETRLCFWVTY
ncbi:hypothetical protein D3C86_2002380 [compost metagenome]